MPRVDVEGIGLVDFPDDMSDADIVSVIENEILKPQTSAPPIRATPAPEVVVPVAPQESTVQTPPESSGIWDDLTNTGRAFQRGLQNIRQTVGTQGVSNAVGAAARVQYRGGGLAEFDAFLAQPETQALIARDPIARSNFEQRRNRLISQQAEAQGETEFRAKQIPSSLAQIAKAEKAKEALPATGGLKEFQEGDWKKALRENPVEVTAGIIAESLPQMAPALAATVIGGPAAGAAATAASSYSIEASSGILDSMRRQGVDITDEESMREFFNDPEKMEAARAFAAKRGIPIAIFDAASVGLAGRILRPALGKGAKYVAPAILGETAMQAIAGGGGEALAQVASTGGIESGRDIAAEMVAEVGSAAPEAYGNLRQDRQVAAAQSQQITDLVQQGLNPKQISERLGMDEETVRRRGLEILNQETAPETPVTPIESLAAPEVEPAVEEIPVQEQAAQEVAAAAITPEPEAPVQAQSQEVLGIEPTPIETAAFTLPEDFAPIEVDTFERESGEVLEAGNVAFRDPVTNQVFQIPESTTQEQFDALLEGVRQQELEAMRRSQEEERTAEQAELRELDSIVHRPDNVPVAMWDNPIQLQQFLEREVPRLRRTDKAAAQRVQEQLTARIEELRNPPQPSMAPVVEVQPNEPTQQEQVQTPAPEPAPAPQQPSPEANPQRNAPEPAATPRTPTESPVQPVASFAEEVNQAATNTPESGKLGPQKAFIHDVWQQWQKDTGKQMSFEDFKKQLLQESRAGNVSLSRLDFYIPGTDAQVRGEASQLQDGRETFNFVNVPRQKKPTAAALPPQQPPAAAPATPAPVPEGEPIGIRNALTDERRDKLGLPERSTPERRSFETVLNDAQAAMANNKNLLPNLLNELTENPRPVTDTEDAVLTYELVQRELEVENATAELNQSTPDTYATAAARVQQAVDEVQALYNILNAVGTANARALNARKLLVNRDFSLARMMAQVRAVENQGAPLSPEQVQKVTQQHSDIQAARQAVEKMGAEQQQAQDEAVMEKIIEEEKPAAQKAKSTKSKVAKFIENQANEARARLKENIKKLGSQLGSSPDIATTTAIASDLAIVGASYIAKGINSLAAFTARLVKEFGEGVRGMAQQAFTAAQQQYDANQKAFNAPKTPEGVVQAAQAENAAIDQQLVSEVVRSHIRAGFTGFEPIITATTNSLKALNPNLTESEVRTIFSNYGKVRYPSKNALEKEVRRLKTLSRLREQLEDVRKGKAPKKTGFQRDPTDAEIRQAEKQVREEMAALGIQTTDPARQLASRLQAIKTRLQNEIAEVERALATNTRLVGQQRTIQYDQEAQALQQRLEGLRARYQEAFPPTLITPEEQISRAIRSVDQSIQEEEQMLREGVLRRPAPTPGPTNDVLDNKRMELAALRQLRRELYAEQNPGKSPEQQALDAAIAAANRSIQRFQQMLTTGNLSPAQRVARFQDNDALNDLRMERDALSDLVAELRRAERPQRSAEDKLIRSMEKSIAQMDQQLLTGNLDGRPRMVNRPDTERVAQLREIRDTMRQTLAEARKARLPQRTPEERRLAADLKAIDRRMKELQDRINRGDYSPRPKRAPQNDPKYREAQRKYQQVREEYLKRLLAAQRAQWGRVKRGANGVMQLLGLARAMKVGFDFSAVLRQGKFAAVAHPIIAARALPKMFRAAFSEQASFNFLQELQERENFQNGLYKQGKLDFTNVGDITLNKVEEDFQSELINTLPRKSIIGPALRASQRGYVAFLNEVRADVFDSLAADITPTGIPTTQQARLLGNMINAETGRGNVGKYGSAIPVANMFLFATRFYVSRIQLLIGQPIWGAWSDPQARKIILKEYGRFLAGMAAWYGMYTLLYGIKGRDDDKGLVIDPRSSDFGKFVDGQTRIDPLAGLSQFVVFLTRMATGESVNDKGQVKKLRGGAQRFKDADIDKTIQRFIESKRSPNAALIHDLIRQKHYGDLPVTPTSVLDQLLTPLNANEILEAMQAQGVPKGTAYTMLMLLGEGVQTYSNDRRDFPTKVYSGVTGNPTPQPVRVGTRPKSAFKLDK